MGLALYDPPIEGRTHVVRLDELEQVPLSDDERGRAEPDLESLRTHPEYGEAIA